MAAHILVVEDDVPLADNLCEILALFGYAPTAVGSAEAALDQAAAVPVDLIVTDVRLPGMNGIAFLDCLRSQHPAIPAVLMSDWSSDDGSNDRSSMVAFLAKPLDIPALVRAIARLLDRANFPADHARS